MSTFLLLTVVRGGACGLASPKSVKKNWLLSLSLSLSHTHTAKEGVAMAVVVICGFGLCLWFMGSVCASCVLCLNKFIGCGGRWRRGRWDYFGFDLGLCSCVLFWFVLACDTERDGDERKRELIGFKVKILKHKRPVWKHNHIWRAKIKSQRELIWSSKFQLYSWKTIYRSCAW